MNQHLFGRFADWQMSHRRWVVLALAVGSIAALALLSRLEFDFRPEALLEFSQEEEEFSRAFKERFSIQDNILLLVLKGTEDGSVLDPRGLTILHRLTEIAAASEISTQAISLTTLPRRDAATGLSAFAFGRLPPVVEALPISPEVADQARRQVEQSRLIPGQLISADGSAAAIVVVLEAPFEDHSLLDRPLAELQTRLRALLRTEAAALVAGGRRPGDGNRGAEVEPAERREAGRRRSTGCTSAACPSCGSRRCAI